MKITGITWNWFVTDRPHSQTAKVGDNGVTRITEQTIGKHRCTIEYKDGDALTVFNVNAIERRPLTKEEKEEESKKVTDDLPF